MPTYLSQAAVARRLEIGRAAVVNYVKRYPDEVPKPAAYLEPDGTQKPLPLWLPEQMGDWVVFRMKRSGPQLRALVAALHHQAKDAGFGSIEELMHSLPTEPDATEPDTGAEAE